MWKRGRSAQWNARRKTRRSTNADSLNFRRVCGGLPCATAGGTPAPSRASPTRISSSAVFAAGRCWHELAGAQSSGNRRRPQHKKVSTLRFWASVAPVSHPRRRKLREPWALLAQVLFLLLVVLALANPRWGGLFEGRSVVLVFDTSIWSQARPANETPWIDRERAEALRLVDSLPSSDRVLLLRAEAAAPPIVPFTTDRAALRRAIGAAQSSSGIADIPRVLEMGRAALAGSRRGLLAYVGPGMLDEEQARRLQEFRAELETSRENGSHPQFHGTF